MEALEIQLDAYDLGGIEPDHGPIQYNGGGRYGDYVGNPSMVNGENAFYSSLATLEQRANERGKFRLFCS